MTDIGGVSATAEKETTEEAPEVVTTEPEPIPKKPAAAPAAAAIAMPRMAAIDILRGFVMVLMAIDHASAAFNKNRFMLDSAFMGWKAGMELHPLYFLTRWMTHLCAPTFVALAGTALAISTESRRAKGQSEGTIDRHILTRGAILLCFEFLWMSWGMLWELGSFLCQVIYAIGGSLILMTFFRRLSDRALVIAALVIVFGSELAIGFFAGAGELDTLPVALTIGGGFFFDRHLIIAYPVLPWCGMMCLGWAFGRRLIKWKREGKDETKQASRFLLIAGVISLAIFLVLRGLNGFGNLVLYRDSADFLQWLHVSKYPPSATYQTLELGIAALLLSGLMRFGSNLPKFFSPFQLLGSTALFFYLLHIHILELVAHVTKTEKTFGTGAAYIGGLSVVVLLYPLCRWYRGYKTRHPNGWAKWI